MSDTLKNAYRNMLRKLLPLGMAWVQVRIDKIWDALAIEFARIDCRGADLLRESDPGNATDAELLPDWEQLLGLPDECTPVGQTEAERQVQARQKLAAYGGLNAQYYIDIAALLGFELAIRNTVDFRSGTRINQRIESIASRFQFTSGSRINQPLNVAGWDFYFVATLTLGEDTLFRSGEGRSGDRLREFGNELLECTIKKKKPAHVGVCFTFIE